jgi:hypothetical protein
MGEGLDKEATNGSQRFHRDEEATRELQKRMFHHYEGSLSQPNAVSGSGLG